MIKILLLSLSLILTGCSAVQEFRKPQMFDSFDDFKPGPEDGVDLIWAKRGIRSPADLQEKLANYDSIIIDQVWLVLDEKERYGSLDNDEIRELADYLVEQLKIKANSQFRVVTEPGDKTLRLSMALTNVDTPNPILAVTSSVLPFGLGISTVSKVVTGEHTNVGSATIELMLSDAITGQPIIAAIDKRTGNKDFSTMIDSSDDAKDAINWWVERLGATFRAEN